MTADDMDQLFARVEHILRAAVDALPDIDWYERLDQCERTGEYGIRMVPGNDAVTFTWGDRPLAVVDRALLMTGEDT